MYIYNNKIVFQDFIKKIKKRLTKIQMFAIFNLIKYKGVSSK